MATYKLRKMVQLAEVSEELKRMKRWSEC